SSRRIDCLLIFQPILVVSDSLTQLNRGVAQGLFQLLILVRIKPPKSWKVEIVANPCEHSLWIPELVPENETVIRSSPLQDDVVVVCDDAIEFLQQLYPFIQIKRLGVG